VGVTLGRAATGAASGYLQAVREKGDQNVRVGAMLQLMADRTYAQFALSDLNTDSICVNCT